MLVLSARNVKALAVGGTITLKFSKSAQYQVSVDEFSGVTGPDKSSSAWGTSSSFSSGSTSTTSQPRELLFGVVGNKSSGVPAWASGWTALPALSSSTSTLTAAYQVVSATGAFAATAHFSPTAPPNGPADRR